jgi:hypothetical protein
MQHQQSGNALDIESLRSDRIFIHVQLDEADAAGHLRGKLIDHWRDHPAWTAPSRPHIDYYGKGRALDFGRKGGVGDGDRFVGERQRRLATPADGFQTLLNLFQRHTIDHAAARTSNQLWIRHTSSSQSLQRSDSFSR